MTVIPDRLLNDVHLSLSTKRTKSVNIKGKYAYYHYCCDDIDDRGWGCGYRTLQTISSWIFYNCRNSSKSNQISVPSILDIQRALVAMEDKTKTFIGSKEWIGSFEICICIDYFYDASCKLHHIPAGEVINAINILKKHFTENSSPVMMGGDTDASSKCILGVAGEYEEDYEILILDPHCCATEISLENLEKQKWIAWHSIHSLSRTSFYNLCLPQVKQK
ncbi:ufm1-specific protease 1-like [Clavelina lepadiformis]|uniref:UFSP1/2/DUB catalytic domain-containing protein n=1 Tax=Clavelina lepadiformis TaxID=159417 RepID=A0ABP0F0K1_CLALP